MNTTDKPVDDDPYDGLPPQSPEEEAAMQEEIELLLKQYAPITPPSLLPILRERLEHALRTHPYPRHLIRSFAARKPVAASGEGRIDGTEESDGEAGGKEGA